MKFFPIIYVFPLVSSWRGETEESKLSKSKPSWTNFIKSCNTPQGLESSLKNEAFKASSSHKSTITQGTWSAYDARLNHAPTWEVTNAWMPEFDHSLDHTYLEVDLGKVKILTGMASQGANRYLKDHYIKQFKIEVSEDGQNWKTLQKPEAENRPKIHKSGKMTENKDDLIFYGNNDDSTIVANYMPYVVLARYVRIRVVTYHNWPALRMEFYGCDYSKDMIFPENRINDVFTALRMQYHMVNKN
jgi:hypothetical protein